LAGREIDLQREVVEAGIEFLLTFGKLTDIGSKPIHLQRKLIEVASQLVHAFFLLASLEGEQLQLDSGLFESFVNRHGERQPLPV
jgi:hypothetical protein